MLYTRKGDGGTTGLFGTAERVPKDHPMFEALGSVDELNALTGLIRAYVRTYEEDERTAGELERAQETLFIVQAQLAGADKRVSQPQVDAAEAAIDTLESAITKPTSFVVPGATVESALFDYARAVTRRAERAVVRSQAAPELRAYLNRLSSLFYALARHAAQRENAQERAPTYH